jgi:hypothetical protein
LIQIIEQIIYTTGKTDSALVGWLEHPIYLYKATFFVGFAGVNLKMFLCFVFEM